MRDPTPTDGLLYARALDRFLDGASRQGELSVARVRAVLVSAAFVRLMLMGGFADFVQGHPKLLIVTTFMTVGCALSWWWVWKVPRIERLGLWPVASVALDGLLAFGIFAPMAIWPPDGYPGFLHVTDFAIVPLLVFGAGFRLSPAAAGVGTVAGLAVCNGMVLLDHQLAPASVTYGGASIAMAWMLLAASGALAFALGGRVRSLVRAGASEAVRAEHARMRLGAYVSEEVAAKVLDEPELVLGGEAREVAVLFSDLRGFTRYAERSQPHALVRELNAYLDAMVKVIREEGGVVDKYMGDAIMVVFGVSGTRGDEAARAIRAADRMCAALQRHNRERAEGGLPPLRQGIGVHYGSVVAGHVGTPERLQYTVVGDTVNLASRLEGATKAEGVEVLLSADVVAAAGSEPIPAVRKLRTLPIRGREGGLEVWTLGEAQPIDASARQPEASTA